MRRTAGRLEAGRWLVAEEMDFVSVAVEARVASRASETFDGC